jgi:serine/threonine protein kinase/CheY-specific phosphatase CheX
VKVTREATLAALIGAVHRVYGEMAFLEAKPCEPSQVRRNAGSRMLWSWISVVEPCPATLVLAQPLEIANEVARTLLGSEEEPRLQEALDAQCELTNVIAGQVLTAIVPAGVAVRLGLPRSGQGAPDVRHGVWAAQTFQAGDWWLAAFIQGADLLAGDEPPRPEADPAKRLEPLTRKIRHEELEVVEPALPIAIPVAPPVAARPATQRPSSPLPVVSVPSGPPPDPSRGSQRRPAVRTINGLVPTGRDPSAVTPPPVQRKDDETLPWFRNPRNRHAAAADVPEALGHYRIVQKIGEGGMGTVFKARHDTLDRLVALKVMKREFAADEAFAACFMREARLAAALEHPNLVTIYDAAREGGHLYMALRYLDGGDLTGLLQREGALLEARAIAMFRGLLSGLQAITAKGLVHRDIKPANILLDQAGNALLGDLGLAWSRHEDQASNPELDRMGTPSYMSPEQLRGDAGLDVRTDLYSLGLSLYVTLTCRQPLQGPDMMRTMGNVLNMVPPDPRSLNPVISEALAAVVMKAIRKDPAQRYQTVVEFLAALEEAEQQGLGDPNASGVTWFGRMFGAKPH